ncbi:MAG: hypothetical protein A3I92_00695 [Candidatus Yanofskybacteria bacterium RIFCSPLOWO2_02_FULL_43_10b]|uniref:Uncharacterized protein n=1 Tax=Candidatus Yanofskybacteria bacterium RIFCSPLOWO2_02_FULL_43_10b TaxID=1802704 RepID=A0A1F8H5L9_9BACT|nr:MAG: hypothetical protein A3I92_00695 [Candidatus Yanofskybacteria bacterium RIFCSPLOWO2_02_FULL_43_10b]
MIKTIKKLFLILFLTLLSLGSVGAAQDDEVYTYVFHLYFDNGKLVADRDFKVSFDLIAQEFEGSDRIPGSYYGEILSVTGRKLADFNVEIPSGTGIYYGAKSSPQAPYFANAKRADFYDPLNEKLLSIDLAPFGPVCNEDNICNADMGETSLNCSSDCQVAPSVSPEINFPPVERDFFGFFSNPTFYIILGIIILVAVLVWMLIKRKRNIPPEIPPQL